MFLRRLLLLVPSVLFLALVTLLVEIGWLETCPLALIGAEHEVAGPALCQIEFFLNRYQTLIGSLVALSAALYAVSPVWRQLRLVSVQAATDLIPHLRQEADEIASDKILLAGVGQIAVLLRSTQTLVNGVSNPVGDTIDALQDIWRAVLALKQSGSVDQFATRVTLDADERKRRRKLVSIIDDVALLHDRIVETVRPPGGMPISPYYEQIGPQFSNIVRTRVPPILEQLTVEIESSTSAVRSMESALQSKTELTLRIAKGFVD